MCDILQSVREEISDIEKVCVRSQAESDEVYSAAEPSLENMPLEVCCSH